MAEVKKGIFYTLGFLFLAGLILSLAAIAYKNFNFSQERFSEILILDKIYNIDSSIKNGFKDIINIKSGITINKGASIIFSEPLPNMNNINDVLDEYEDFLESNFSVLVNIEDIKTRLPLKIKPHEIEYFHQDFGDNTINVNANETNFEGYTVSVTTKEDLKGNSCAASGKKQDVYLVFYASGKNKDCSENGKSKSKVDLYSSSGQQIATVSVTGNDLSASSFLPINITISIDNLNNLGITYILLPKEALYLNFTEFNITKNSTINLL